MHEPFFKLNENPKGKGLRCDDSGLFFAGNALLRRDGAGNFAARPDDELRKCLGSVHSGEANFESRVRNVKLIATALNKGEMARAMMTAVLMRLRDPGSRIGTDADDVLAKGYNPDEPRDERGRWANDGGSPNSPLSATLSSSRDDATNGGSGRISSVNSGSVKNESHDGFFQPVSFVRPNSYTHNGVTYQTAANLNQHQLDTLNQIIDYGVANGYSNDTITVAVNQAFNESSLGDNEMQPSGTHTGLFQYDTSADPRTVWNAYHSGLNIYSDSDQIAAMYADVTLFAAAYANGEANGQIPSDLSFDDYVEIKHHAGQNTTDFSSTASARAVLGYTAAKADLGFSITANANRAI